MLAVAVAAACGGAQARRDPAGEESPAHADPGRGPSPASPTAVTPVCLGAYREYVRAWDAWFRAELGDAATAAEIVAEFGQELPTRATLAEMREVADELRYQPGFDLWFVALTSSERAIAACGEGASRPR